MSQLGDELRAQGLLAELGESSGALEATGPLPPKGTSRIGKRSHLLRRAWNRPVGAEYATVPREWLEALAAT
jgi:hypothetical protein